MWEGLHAMLPELLLLRGRSEEALAVSRRMTASGPGSGAIVGHALAAEALLQLGRRDEARAEARLSDEAVDGWSGGIIWVQRYVTEARRAGREPLAKALAAVLAKIAPVVRRDR